MEQATVTTNRRLVRGNGPLGGVAAGMADYFGIDPTIVRLGLVATTLLGGPTIPIAYLAAWIIIPDGAEGSGASAPMAPTNTWPTPPPPPPAPPAPAPAEDMVMTDTATGPFVDVDAGVELDQPHDDVMATEAEVDAEESAIETDPTGDEGDR